MATQKVASYATVPTARELLVRFTVVARTHDERVGLRDGVCCSGRCPPARTFIARGCFDVIPLQHVLIQKQLCGLQQHHGRRIRASGFCVHSRQLAKSAAVHDEPCTPQPYLRPLPSQPATGGAPTSDDCDVETYLAAVHW